MNICFQPIIRNISLALVLCSVNAAATEINFFRYKNEQGTLVTSTILPPKFATRGYEIVNSQGDILEVVAPAMTPEERAEYERKNKEAILAEQQREKDRDLLLRYADIRELQKAKDRKVKELESSIAILKNNTTGLLSQIESEQQKAVRYERDGKEIPLSILEALDSLYFELESVRDLIVLRQEELEKVRLEFDANIVRYRIISKQVNRN
ncbi:MAG: hypothetical protein KDI30_00265 [Pseudomonadales bacterium]|nr:hypothetical protein [Pseudomonadales bacterium]